MIETEMVEKLFVGGEWIGSSASGESFDAINPAKGALLATLPHAGRAVITASRSTSTSGMSLWGASHGGRRG